MCIWVKCTCLFTHVSICRRQQLWRSVFPGRERKAVVKMSSWEDLSRSEQLRRRRSCSRSLPVERQQQREIRLQNLILRVLWFLVLVSIRLGTLLGQHKWTNCDLYFMRLKSTYLLSGWDSGLSEKGTSCETRDLSASADLSKSAQWEIFINNHCSRSLLLLSGLNTTV